MSCSRVSGRAYAQPPAASFNPASMRSHSQPVLRARSPTRPYRTLKILVPGCFWIPIHCAGRGAALLAGGDGALEARNKARVHAQELVAAVGSSMVRGLGLGVEATAAIDVRRALDLR